MILSTGLKWTFVDGSKSWAVSELLPQILTGTVCLYLLPGPGSRERRWQILWPGGAEAQQQCTKRGRALCVLPASIHTDSRLKGDWSSPIRTAPLCMMVTSLLRGVPGDSTHLPVYQLHPFSVPHLVLPSLPECQGLRFMLTFPCLCPPDTVRTGNCFSKD